MQYLLIFFAVLVVILCMLVFIFLAIRQTADHMKSQVQDRFMQELSSFDELYEQKADRIRQLREEQALADSNIFKKQEKKDEVKTSYEVTSTASGFDFPVSRTVSAGFFKEYRYIREHFQVDCRKALERVIEKPQSPEADLGRKAAETLSLISMETAFSMSTLEPDEQLEILRESLTPGAAQLLSQYESQQEDEPFDCLKFREYARITEKLFSDRITVYTGNSSWQPDNQEVTTVYDDTINEGVRVVRGNQMYDFSL